MKRLYSSLSFLIFVFLFASCAETTTLNQDLLYGSWQGSNWTVDGEDSGRDAGAVRFQFNINGDYIAVFGDDAEQGTFRLESDKLYTTEEGQLEKAVRIITLSMDSLVFDMNRQGQDESLTLLKIK